MHNVEVVESGHVVIKVLSYNDRTNDDVRQSASSALENGKVVRIYWPDRQAFQFWPRQPFSSLESWNHVVSAYVSRIDVIAWEA